MNSIYIATFDNHIYNAKKHLLIKRVNRVNGRNSASFYNPHGFARYYTSDSALYLLKLVSECTEPRLPQIAYDILETILNMQCTNPGSDNFGLWSFNAEKDIISDSNPDGNIASFIGVPFLIILIEYSHFFDNQTLIRLENALKRACIYIIHRQTASTNTHITYSEVFMTAACGEKFNIPEFVHYSTIQFQNLYNNALLHNSFNIYNSPHFDFYSLHEIYFICRYIKNDTIVKMAKKLNEIHWEIIAKHYHFKSGEIAAPATRLTEPNGLLKHQKKQFLADIGNTDKYHNKILDFRYALPTKFLGYFKKSRTGFEQTIVTNGYAFPYFNFSQVASTQIHPEYTLGSFSRNLIWTETTPFFAHFGTFDSPFSATVTVLHDNLPFSSSESAALQFQNYVLGHITFALNRADKHISGDPINGRICANDLRIRFIVTGNISKIKYIADGSKIKIKANTVTLLFSYDYFEFDKLKPSISIQNSKDNLCFDLVLHKGRKKIIDFNKMKKAIAAYSFHITENNCAAFPSVRYKYKKKYFISQLNIQKSTNIQLKSLYSPDTNENIQSQNRHYINGCILEKYVKQRSLDAANFSYIDKFSPAFPITLITKSNDKLSLDIDSILNIEVKYIIQYVKELLKNINENDLNLAIQKRIAMQILVNSYEVFKKYDLKFEVIISQISNTATLKISAAKNLEEIAYIVLQLLNNLYDIYLNNTKSHSNTLLKAITQIIDSEFQNPDLSLEYISERLNTPIYTLSKIFKNSTKISYNDYLTKKRMEYAKTLISSTDSDINEITLKCGYLNVSSFRRSFKAYSGMTISQFKKLMINK